jgi:hypothetical protein
VIGVGSSWRRPGSLTVTCRAGVQRQFGEVEDLRERREEVRTVDGA